MKTNLLALIISLVVGIILAGSMLMPVINDATEVEKTFDNRTNALFQVEKLDENSDYTFEWSYEDPTNATVNGETVGLENATVICSLDSFLLRYGNNATYGHYLQSVGGTLNIIVTENATADQGSITVTAIEGTITAVLVKGENTTTKTITYTEGYGIASKGDYVMKSPTQSAYMLTDSPIVAMGLTTLDGSWANMFQITGVIEAVEVTQVYPSPATYTISDVEIQANEVAEYIDLYKLDAITFVATNISDTTKTTDCTYNYFIVPATVTSERAQHLSPGEIAIMNALPVLIIVALVVMAARALYLKRDD